MKPIDFDRETLRRAAHAAADQLDKACSEAENGGEDTFLLDVMGVLTMAQLDSLSRDFAMTLIHSGEQEGKLKEGAYEAFRDLMRERKNPS